MINIFFNWQLKFGCQLLFVVMLFSCENIKSQTASTQLEKLAFVTNIPEVGVNGNLMNFRDSIPIYYFDSFVLYKLPYLYEEKIPEKVSGNANSDTIKLHKTVFEEIRYSYFICRRNHRFGIIANDLNDFNSKKIASLDSIKNRNFYGSTDICGALKGDSLHKVLYDSIKNSVVQIFIPRIERDDGDTIYLYFSKDFYFSDLSFSKRLDSITQLKLNKFRVVYNMKKSLTTNVIMPNREFYFEIKKIARSEEDKLVISFFEKIIKKNILKDFL